MANQENRSTPGRSAPASGPMFPFRTVVLGAFLPSLVYDLGFGAVMPIIAGMATALGADLPTAGFITALLPIGKVLFDVPAGELSGRIGDRKAMLVAGVVACLAYTAAALTPVLWGLGAAVLAVGASSAVFNLARQAYLTEITPPLRRARVLSTLAGVHRIGLFLGPLAGAAIIEWTSLHGGFWWGAGVSAAAVIIVLAVPDDEAVAVKLKTAKAARISIATVARDHAKLLGTLGIAVLMLTAVRGARMTVLPLWGEHLGFDPQVTSLLFGLAGGVDMLLFYPAGKVMDRFGRLWIGIPSMVTMGVALLVLPFTHTIAAVGVCAALLGIGNGMSSGIVMTLGADVAPPDGRSTFLGLWRLFQDTGDALGPLVLSAGAAIGSLAAGIWAMSLVSVGSAGSLAKWVPFYTPYGNLVKRHRR